MKTLKVFPLAASLAFVATSANAASCLPFFKGNGTPVINMVTMNRLGVGSSAIGNAQIVHEKIPNGPSIDRLNSQNAPQTFSDRTNSSNQNFDITKSDKIDISVSVAANPSGTVTLLSHGNGKSTFALTCSTTGIMHGSTNDVDYLFFVTFLPPIQ